MARIISIIYKEKTWIIHEIFWNVPQLGLKKQGKADFFLLTGLVLVRPLDFEKGKSVHQSETRMDLRILNQPIRSLWIGMKIQNSKLSGLTWP